MTEALTYAMGKASFWARYVAREIPECAVSTITSVFLKADFLSSKFYKLVNNLSSLILDRKKVLYNLYKWDLAYRMHI